MGNDRGFPGEGIGLTDAIKFSPDGKKLATSSHRARRAQIFDLETGKVITVPHTGGIATVEFSPKSEKLATSSHDKTARVVDLVTGRESTIRHAAALAQATFSSDGKKLLTVDNRSVKVSRPDGLLLKEFQTEDGISSARLSPDGKSVAVLTKQKAIVLDLETARELVIPKDGFSEWDSFAFSPDGKSFVIVSRFASRFFDLESGKENANKIKRDRGGSYTKFSPDGKKLLIKSDDGARITDMGSGKEFFIAHQKYFYPTFSPDSQNLTMVSLGGSTKVIDLNTGNERSVKRAQDFGYPDTSPDGKKILLESRDSVEVFDLEGALKLSVANAENATFSPDSKFVAIAKSPRGIEVNSLETLCVSRTPPVELPGKHIPIPTELLPLCATPFDDRAWSKLETGALPKTESEVMHALLRFQKPGGFNPEKHLKVLVPILKNRELCEANSAAIQAVLSNLVNQSNALYRDLLEKFPFLLDLKPDSLQECTTPQERKTVDNGVKAYVRQLEKLNLGRTELKDWAPLSPLRASLARLEPAIKEGFIDKIATSLQEAAADNREYSDIFGSKIYYFSKAIAEEWFGLASDLPLVDMTFSRTPKGFVPIAMALHPIDSSVETRSPYGFYLKRYPEITLDLSKPGPADLGARNTRRFTDGQTHLRARFAVTIGKEADLVSDLKTFPYDALKNNGVTTGAIMVGTNMADQSKDLLDRYARYYTKRGFEFKEPVQQTTSSEYLKQQISSGRLGYFLKEAHSDGDEKNLFRMPRNVTIRVGERKLNGKVVERVELVYPNGGGSSLISNQEFGDWIKKRTAPLVYFNTSCNSRFKAVNEITAAGKKLIDVCSGSSIYPFQDSETDATYQLLSGFLDRKDFAAIRSDLKKDSEYEKGTSQQYWLPDDDRYQRQIVSMVKIPLDIRIELVDEDTGRPVVFDERIQHRPR